MAEKRSGPGEGARRGKRAAPTIDLTATDVTPPAAEAASQQAAPEPPLQPTPEPPHTESPPAVEPPARGSASISGLLAAGAAGSVVTAVVLLGLWLAGFGRVQQTLPAAPPDTKVIDAITQRVGKIEEAIAKLPPSDATLADRVAAADNAMKALGPALTAINKRSDDVAATAAQARDRADAAEKAVTELRANVQDAAKTASPAISSSELDALQKRLAALEQSAQSAHDELARATSIEKTTQLALAAAALREAVESGAPFAAELKQAQALGAHSNVLAPLGPFAATGVPSAQALAQEMRTLLPGLAKTADVQPSGNFFQRLQANAGKLVHVRRIDAPAGDDASAVLARLEIDASRADIAAVVADLAKLPDTSRARTQAWVDKAKAREAALAAARKFAGDAARSLGAR
jgi:hypothetical protein